MKYAVAVSIPATIGSMLEVDLRPVNYGYDLWFISENKANLIAELKKVQERAQQQIEWLEVRS